MMSKIGIIGAEISGLLACKHVMEKGFTPVLFEARNGIGGLWSQTLESTKLQSPRNLYQFSDFPWPSSIKETFPDHNQLMEYIEDYDKMIKFNSKVTCIDYVTASVENLLSWDLWSGTGDAISPAGKWNISVQDARDPSAPIKVYQVDFVILCIGRFSDLPYIPDFPVNKGPQVFGGKTLHSMDYAAMDDDSAAKFVKNNRVTVVGFQKSATDLAVEVATRNGVEQPCTLLYRTVYWAVPEYLLLLICKCLNRFTESIIHKPGEGFVSWLSATFLFPLFCVLSKLMECYLKWTQPLKEYNLVPPHGFLKQVTACMLSVLPPNFYAMVKEGTLVLKKSQSFSFWKNGLIIEGDESPLETDIVIFATGYKGDGKLKNIFKSDYFRDRITGSAPLYRECIHPRIPQLAILGLANSYATLYTTEMRSKWLAHFLAGTFKLPALSEMEAEMTKWEEYRKYYAKGWYKRSCLNMFSQIYCNDLLCKDMGYNSRRKKWFIAELFSPYGPMITNIYRLSPTKN